MWGTTCTLGRGGGGERGGCGDEGSEKRPSHLLYNPGQAREAEGEGEIKKHRPHTTTICSSPVHPPGSPRSSLPSHSFFLALSPPHRTSLRLRYRAARGDRGQKRPTRVWWFNSVRIGFPIERSLMASGHASKPRVTTICEMESQQDTRSIFFFLLFPVPWAVRKEESFPIHVSGPLPRTFCTTRHTSVGALPSLDIGWSCVSVRRQSSI